MPTYLNQWRKVGAFEGFHREILFRKNLHLDMAALQTEFYFAEPWAAGIEGGIRRLRLLSQLSHLYISGCLGTFVSLSGHCVHVTGGLYTTSSPLCGVGSSLHLWSPVGHVGLNHFLAETFGRAVSKE